ncbi:MAG: hypothetical protein HQL87_03120 [Magnetococcales bacterium]|nr:hypothetical protein [Magnetococcales bacterium]
MIIISAIPVRTLDARLRGNDERISCHTHSRHAREGGHPGECVNETMIKASRIISFACDDTRNNH